MIPKQLQNQNFRFNLLPKNKKGAPLEKDWQNTKNYSFDSEILQKHIKEGGNYGVVGNFGALCILDIDNATLAAELYQKLNTFTVRTCGGLYHFYFVSDYNKSTSKSGIGEFRSKGNYVVGPGCYAEDGTKGHKGKYEVVKDIPIQYYQKEIMETQVLNLFKTVKRDNSKSGVEFHEVRRLIKKNWDFERVNAYMVARSFAKWIEKPESYRILTYDSATESVKKERTYVSETLGEFTNFKQMAEKFYERQPVYYDNGKNWWLWNWENKFWKMADETELLVIIDNHIKEAKTLNTNVKTMILEAMRRIGRRKQPEEMPKTWVQFQNGIVDLESGKIIEPNPIFFTTNPIPWNIGESEDTPEIDKIFEEWVGKDYIKTLYEIMAYCMLADYPIHRLFCLIGSGLNGKTKFLELVNRFVGTDNTTSTELDTLLKSRFEITRLHKKLVCTMGETNFATISKTSMLKKLTGQDRIGFEYKNKNPFDDYNYAKIIIASNSLPMTSDTTIGYYRRWQIIDFPNRFTESFDVLNRISDIEYENLAKKCINILKILIHVRKFTNEGSIEDRMKRYEEKSNPLGKFVKDICEEDINGVILYSIFYNKFTKYLIENKYRVMSKNEVGKILGYLGYNKKFKTIDGKSANYILGLKFNGENIENIENIDNFI